MCLIFIGYKCSSHHRFLLAANRDEFRNRPAASLGYLNPEKTIIGGQDLQAGGMWLGVRSGGAFGAVTNFRDGTAGNADLPSRGEIVYNFLSSGLSAMNAMEDVAGAADKYAGVNIVFGDQQALVYYSNRENKIRVLQPGFYGLSNHLLDTPWPKVERGKELLYPFMVSGKALDDRKILSLLQDDTVPPDDLLPNTGVGLDLERLLGSIFITGKDYGTVSSAVVQIQSKGDVIFSEISYIDDAKGGRKPMYKQMVLR